MPYSRRLDRELEPELFLIVGIYGRLPGFESVFRYRRLESIKEFYESHPEIIAFLVGHGAKEKTRELLPLLLDERQQQVISLRFGLQDGTVYTLDETTQYIQRIKGDSMYPVGEPVSGERIRQIEAKALRRFRHPSRSRELRNYLMSLAEQLNIPKNESSEEI